MGKRKNFPILADMTDDPRKWMWADALQMLARAERLHRTVFNAPQASQRGIGWEPPADVLETDSMVLILVALPGVDPNQIRLGLQGGVLTISGERVLPQELRTATIHRMELPQGRFERRVPIPPGRYEQPRTGVSNGCVVIQLVKAPLPQATKVQP
ncbi:MAG: Hsp20/alpha crystallin family protein [Reyranella sp.]|uniref:Hsp20/alpha crystallin family protein n=1 Tax=Reyranella sp. TaxID=1929291 RepID=UPI003D11C474